MVVLEKEIILLEIFENFIKYNKKEKFENYITNKDYFDNDIEFDNYKIFYTPVTAINKPETTTE